MSYNIRLKGPSGETVLLDQPHNFKGGTYCIGGDSEAWLSVTYNYAPHYRRTLGERGIRTIYGLTGAESLPLLDRAISQLADDVDPDYWKPTEGNARAALVQLRALAEQCPDAVWDGD